MTENEIPLIIRGIKDLGDILVDWLEHLNSMVELIGVPGVVIVLWAVLPLVMTVLLITIITLNSKQSKRNNEAFSTQIENLATAITILTDKVSSPYLETRQSIILFRSIMAECIHKKIDYLDDVLTKNSIQERRSQIEINMQRKFQQITAEEVEKLSLYKSVCGDMGKVVNNVIKWNVKMGNIYDIFFTADSQHQKLMDIETFLNAEVDKIARILEENGIRN